MRIEIDIPNYTKDELIKRAFPRFSTFSVTGQHGVYKLLACEISYLIHDWLGLPTPAYDEDRVRVFDPSEPVKVHCPECNEEVLVRRVWDCTAAAYVGKATRDGFFPIDSHDVEIDEFCGAARDGSYYCQKCGLTLAEDDEELKKLLEDQKDGKDKDVLS